MSPVEEELERRLRALPDAHPDFIRCAVPIYIKCGIVDEILQLLEERPDATTDTVTMFEGEYCGEIDLFDDDGRRVPVEPQRMLLTRGMREMLAELKGKTLKSYECSSEGGGRERSDEVVRINLGSYSLDLESHVAAVSLGGGTVAELAPMRCEKMSLEDDFRPWSQAPSRAYLVGERVTGVGLVRERAALTGGLGAGGLSIDSGVVLRTARGAYTFARSSWSSATFSIAAAGEAAMPYTQAECREDLERLVGAGAEVGEVARTVVGLA